jgi:uncharacterized membrane protein
VFGNSVLRRLFEPKNDVVIAVWKLSLMRNSIIRIDYQDDQIRWMRWVRHVACMTIMKKAYRILVGRLEGKRALGRHELMR